MRRLRIFLSVLLCMSCYGLGAQDSVRIQLDSSAVLTGDEWTDEYLDTVDVKKKFVLNDYAMVGIHYGVGFHQMSFNPQYLQSTMFIPEYYGVTFSKYETLFNYLHYFGWETGIFYGYEGYRFKKNKETGAISSIRGAEECRFKVIEVPLTAAFHLDMSHFKLVGNLGIYGGYRLSVERLGENLDPSLKNSFSDTDRRLDYGLKGALGFGIVFAPFEFHVKANVRYGWGTIFDPDWYSKDFYRFAYPFDIMVTASLYIQLNKRTGKTNAALKKEAYNIVFSQQNEK